MNTIYFFSIVSVVAAIGLAYTLISDKIEQRKAKLSKH